MSKLSLEQEERKKAIFDGMSARNKKKILDKGYDSWDPFSLPKDPLDIGADQGRRKAWELARDFLQTRSHERFSDDYARGVREICNGIMSGKDRYRAMVDFCCWYQRLLKNGEL